MPNRLLLPLLLLAALGLVWWMVSGSDAPPTYPGDDAPGREGAGVETAPLRTEEPGAALTGSGRPAPPPRPGGRPYRTDAELPRGEIKVTPRDPNGEFLSPKSLAVHIEGAPRPFHIAPTGLPDYETGTWHFRRVIAGAVKIRVTGRHLAETIVDADVPPNGVVEVDVEVAPAGALSYSVVLYSGEQPETVTLTLLDHGSGEPVRVGYQALSAESMSAERLTKEITLGPEGIVFGIRPGRYLLRATSPEGELEEADVEVEAGKTLPVEIRIRR